MANEELLPATSRKFSSEVHISKLFVDIEEFTRNVERHTREEHDVTGDGIFDKMMETATEHLLAQFDGNRIRQENYGEMYARIYEITLNGAIQIWLQKGLTEFNAELLECQAKLACAQAETEKRRPYLVDAQTALTWAQKATEDEKPAQVIAQTELTKAQKVTEDKRPANVEAQTQLVIAQKATEDKKPENVEAQTKLVNAQTTTESKKPANVEAQTKLVNAQTTTESKKPDNIAAQTDLTKKQAATEDKKPAQIAAQTSNVQEQTKLVTAQTVTEHERPELVRCQARLACAQAEVEAEKPDLIRAQIELAKEQVKAALEQTKLLASQAKSEESKMALYKRQIEGFDEDYKYKILKILMDSWAVGFSVAKDSFEASGIPATMQKVTIDDLYNDYIKTDLDRYNYLREQSMLRP